jgi:hypothetical protein
VIFVSSILIAFLAVSLHGALKNTIKFYKNFKKGPFSKKKKDLKISKKR